MDGTTAIDKDMDIVMELTTTPFEGMVEPQALEYNTILPLPYSNNSTTFTVALAVDLILIMKDTTVYGLCTRQIITHYTSVTRVRAYLFLSASLCGAHKTISPRQPGHPIQHT